MKLPTYWIVFGIIGISSIGFSLYKRKKSANVPVSFDQIDPQEMVDRDIAYLKEELGEFGQKLDFSVQSIWALDTWLSEHVQHGKPKGRLKKHFVNKVLCIGEYLAETIRRQAKGGRYELGDIQKFELILHLPDGTVLLPAQMVVKRIQHGEDASLVAYVHGVLSHLKSASHPSQNAQAQALA